MCDIQYVSFSLLFSHTLTVKSQAITAQQLPWQPDVWRRAATDVTREKQHFLSFSSFLLPSLKWVLKQNVILISSHILFKKIQREREIKSKDYVTSIILKQDTPKYSDCNVKSIFFILTRSNTLINPGLCSGTVFNVPLLNYSFHFP